MWPSGGNEGGGSASGVATRGVEYHAAVIREAIEHRYQQVTSPPLRVSCNFCARLWSDHGRDCLPGDALRALSEMTQEIRQRAAAPEGGSAPDAPDA